MVCNKCGLIFNSISNCYVKIMIHFLIDRRIAIALQQAAAAAALILISLPCCKILHEYCADIIVFYAIITIFSSSQQC